MDIPVRVAARGQSGRKRVLFLVDTPARRYRYQLLMNLIPAWEATEVAGGSDPRDGSVVELRVTTRRLDGRGMEPPREISSAGPVRAQFIGRPENRIYASGLSETSRLVRVAKEARPEGSYRAVIRFAWGEGVERLYSLAWEVAPAVKASPAGFTLRRDQLSENHSLLLSSTDDVRFKVVALRSDSPVAFAIEPEGEARRHTLQFKILPEHESPGSRKGGGVVDLVIETDHPRQPSVVVNILTLPEREDP